MKEAGNQDNIGGRRNTTSERTGKTYIVLIYTTRAVFYVVIKIENQEYISMVAIPFLFLPKPRVFDL